MFRNFKLMFLPLEGGGWVGVKEKATHPPFVPPIKGGNIFNSYSRRRPNLKCLNVSGYPLESINKIALLQSMRMERVRPKIRCPKLGIHVRMESRQCRFPPSCARDG